MAQFDDDEPPLDPALIRVQARLRRLMLIGGGTLGLGIFAVLAAVVFRIMSSGSTPDPGDAPPEPVVIAAAAIGLGAGAEAMQVAIDSERIVVLFRDGGDTVLVTLDPGTLGIIATLRIDAP